MALLRSAVFSILASVIGTYLLRRMLSVSEGSGGPGGLPAGNVSPVVVIAPIIVGNNNGNHIGLRRRGPFGRRGWGKQRGGRGKGPGAWPKRG
jgi:hypothetical protein